MVVIFAPSSPWLPVVCDQSISVINLVVFPHLIEQGALVELCQAFLEIKVTHLLYVGNILRRPPVVVIGFFAPLVRLFQRVEWLERSGAL